MARKTVIQLEGVAWVPGPIEYRTMVFMKAAGNELARTVSQSHLSETMSCKNMDMSYLCRKCRVALIPVGEHALQR